MLRRRSGNSAADAIRPLLFGNVPLARWPPDDDVSGETARLFIAARQAIGEGRVADAIAHWRAIAASPDTEARNVLQAWTYLRANGVQPDPTVADGVLGVVVEVPVSGGLDVLAAYRDGSARYLNYSGSVAVLDGVPAADAVAAVVRAGQTLATRIGVWDKVELPPLPRGDSRVTILTPRGFRFGQGPDAQMRAQPIAADLFNAATRVVILIADIGRP